jgi:hypothetical protein
MITCVRPTSEDETLPCARLVASGHGPDLWHPVSGREVPPAVVVACGRCTWRASCLEEALTRPEEHGIWAGLSPTARVTLRQRILLGRDPAGVIADGLAMADRLRLQGRSDR